ncbi:hypothetical protein RYO59_000382 [Thermosynechococcaceae cyanobacterium Okahandja]
MNDSITSTSDKLNIVLNADADSNSLGEIHVNPANLISNGGNIILGGGSDPSTNPASRIVLQGAVLDAGGGNISLRAAGTGDVVLTGSSRITTTSSGSIYIEGNSTGTAGNNTGVTISNALINSGGGSLTITGTGSSGSGSNNTGVAISNAGINSGGGLLTISGIGGSAGTGNWGVAIESAGINNDSGSSGDVNIDGRGGDGGADVFVTNATIGSNSVTNILIEGNAGAGIVQDEATVEAGDNSLIRYSSSGVITLSGGSQTTAGNDSWIFLSAVGNIDQNDSIVQAGDNGSIYYSSSGAITLSGGSQTTAGNDSWIFLSAGDNIDQNDSIVQAGNNGSIYYSSSGAITLSDGSQATAGNDSWIFLSAGGNIDQDYSTVQAGSNSWIGYQSEQDISLDNSSILTGSSSADLDLNAARFINLTNSTVNVSRTLTATAGSRIEQSGGIIANYGLANFRTTQSGIGNVRVNNTTATNLDSSEIGGNFTLTSTGGITQAPDSIVRVAGKAELTGYTVAITPGGDNVLPDFMATETSTGNVTIVRVGPINDLGPLTVTGNLSVTSLASGDVFTTSYTGNDAIVLGGNNSFAGRLELHTDISGTTPISRTPSISQVDSLVVHGTSQFTTNGNGGTITLNNADNQLMGAITLTTGSTGGDIILRNNSPTQLANAVTGSNLTINTNGDLTQSGLISAQGLTILGQGNTVLNNPNNQIGALAANTTGNLTVVNSGTLRVDSVSGTNGIEGANTVLLRTLSGDIVLNRPIHAAGDITLAAHRDFINNAGSTPLVVGTGNRWLVYATSPQGNVNGWPVMGGSEAFSIIYPQSSPFSGNGFLYTTPAPLPPPNPLGSSEPSTPVSPSNPSVPVTPDNPSIPESPNPTSVPVLPDNPTLEAELVQELLARESLELLSGEPLCEFVGEKEIIQHEHLPDEGLIFLPECSTRAE